MEKRIFMAMAPKKLVAANEAQKTWMPLIEKKPEDDGGGEVKKMKGVTTNMKAQKIKLKKCKSK